MSRFDSNEITALVMSITPEKIINSLYSILSGQGEL